MEVGSDSPHLFDAFRYLTSEKAGLYRQIIETFDLARQRFQLHLRPGEVLAACDVSACDDNDIHQALQQLREWGNLDRHIDTAAVQTVAQFNRPRYLFSMTPAGVAAYEAMVAFERRLAQRGKLDTAALGDVRERLMGLDAVLDATPPDLGQAGLHMKALVSEFEKLATEAHVFLQSLHQSIDLQAMEVHLFIAYKEKLLDYLRNFIHELTLVTSEVVPILDRLTLQRVHPVLDRLASKDIASEAPGENTEPGSQAEAVARWENRWRGVCGWFLPIENQRAQAAVLRERARAAIPALLEAVTQINERRVNRSDRTADFRALAHWFLECPSDEEAHRLWLAAFGLGSV